MNLYGYVDNAPTSFIDPPGLGKVGGAIRIVRRIGDWLLLTRSASMRAAQNTLRRGGDVLAPSREMARQVAKGAASKGEKVVHHAPHKERYRPHFQIDGKAGHSFYSVIPLAGLGSMVGRKTGSELLGEAIDFLNPLSDLQDVSDFLTYLSSIQEEDALARAEWIMP